MELAGPLRAISRWKDGLLVDLKAKTVKCLVDLEEVVRKFMNKNNSVILVFLCMLLYLFVCLFVGFTRLDRADLGRAWKEKLTTENIMLPLPVAYIKEGNIYHAESYPTEAKEGHLFSQSSASLFM